MEQMRGRAMGD